MINTSFDVRSDAGGKDPDSHSPTLRRYHQLLWGKQLPGGKIFALDTTTPGEYLHHQSELGEFWLSSDSIIPCYETHANMGPILNQITEKEIEAFITIGSTIGGTTIFPSNKIDSKQTINGARGFHPRIADRMDLTLECIRRHYLDKPSPLGSTLARYNDFFTLFDNFHGYVTYFLLDDLLTADFARVKFFLPFNDFQPPAVPTDVATYRDYTQRSTRFVQARNSRIADDQPPPRPRSARRSVGPGRL